MPGIDNIYLAMTVVVGLMLWDYRQTVKNYDLYTQVLEKHFRREQFELNPIFQHAISERRYHPFHFFGMVVVAGLLYFMHWAAQTGWGNTTIESYYFYQGLILAPFLIIHFRHLSIGATVKILKSDPTALEGSLQESYRFSLRNAGAQAAIFFWLFLFLQLANPSEFMAGITCGTLILVFATKIWLWRAKRPSRE